MLKPARLFATAAFAVIITLLIPLSSFASSIGDCGLRSGQLSNGINSTTISFNETKSGSIESFSPIELQGLSVFSIPVPQRPRIPTFVIVILVAAIAINITIAVVVYQDAKKNNISPEIVWALVSLMASGIGLIIYLVVRHSTKRDRYFVGSNFYSHYNTPYSGGWNSSTQGNYTNTGGQYNTGYNNNQSHGYFCPNCGNPRGQGANFCVHCGSRMT